MDANRINNILTAKARGYEAMGALILYYAVLLALKMEESQAAAYDLYDTLDAMLVAVDLNALQDVKDDLSTGFADTLGTATAIRASWEGQEEPEGQADAWAAMLGHLDGVVASLTSACDACKVEGEAADPDDVNGGPLEAQIRG